MGYPLHKKERTAVADEQQFSSPFSPEGGGLPIHASQFQILIDTAEVTIIFLQKLLAYKPELMTPTITHRVVGQVVLSHMLAKDFARGLTKAMSDFEVQYPIPDIQSPPVTSQPNAG